MKTMLRMNVCRELKTRVCNGTKAKDHKSLTYALDHSHGVITCVLWAKYKYLIVKYQGYHQYRYTAKKPILKQMHVETLPLLSVGGARINTKCLKSTIQHIRRTLRWWREFWQQTSLAYVHGYKKNGDEVGPNFAQRDVFTWGGREQKRQEMACVGRSRSYRLTTAVQRSHKLTLMVYLNERFASCIFLNALQSYLINPILGDDTR